MPTIFETPRLRAEPFRPADFDAVYRLQSDPAVMRFIREPEMEAEAVGARMELWARYAADHPGQGIWALRHKADGALAGYGILCHVLFDAGRELEIGYVLAPEYWGKGLATEIAGGLARYAFERLNAPIVAAYTDPANHASRRVLEKCGFRLQGVRDDYVAGDLYFVLERGGS
jgi:RimJ/RimL family protein N-acetyltransferase